MNSGSAAGYAYGQQDTGSSWTSGDLCSEPGGQGARLCPAIKAQGNLTCSRGATSFHGSFLGKKDRIGSLEMIVACRSGQLQDGHTSPGSTCSEGLGMTL